MGYHWPPSLYAFDPTERPFLWTPATYAEASAAMGLPAPRAEQASYNVTLPNEYDREFLNLISSQGWGTIPPTLKAQGPLLTYISMIAARAPGDPETGGLPADTIDPATGAIHIHYFDLQDPAGAHRKFVRYVPTKKGDGYEIDSSGGWGGIPYVWTRKDNDWHGEGADAEREVWKASGAIMTALVTIASTALAAVPGGQIPAAIFSTAWSVGMKAAMAGKPPDLGDILGAVGSSGVLGVLSRNADLQKAFTTGFIGDMGRRVGTWEAKLGGVIGDYGKNFPRVDVGKLFASDAGQLAMKIAEGALKGMAPPAPPAKFGSPNSEVTMADAPDYVRHAWEAAARAFVEPNPKARLQIRRNFAIAWGGSSNMVHHGNQAGIAAHADIEVGPGIQHATAFFDQFLATMAANLPSIHAPRVIREPSEPFQKPRETKEQADARAAAIVADAYAKKYGEADPRTIAKREAAAVAASKISIHAPRSIPSSDDSIFARGSLFSDEVGPEEGGEEDGLFARGALFR